MFQGTLQTSANPVSIFWDWIYCMMLILVNFLNTILTFCMTEWVKYIEYSKTCKVLNHTLSPELNFILGQLETWELHSAERVEWCGGWFLWERVFTWTSIISTRGQKTERNQDQKMPPVYEFNNPYYFVEDRLRNARLEVGDIPQNTGAGVYLAVSEHVIK